MQIRSQSGKSSMVQQLRRRPSLRAGVTQLVYIAVGVGLGLLLPTIDLGTRLPSGEVVALLAGSSAGLLALIGIVFALLFLVVQFAASAQSPRLVLFRDEPLVWHALGLVFGVMVYAMTCVVVIADDATTSVLVPTSVIVLVVLTVVIVRQLQVDALKSIDLATTLDQVTARTRAVIDGIYTEPFSPTVPPPVAVPENAAQIRWPGTQQVLRQIDLPRLGDLARREGATIRLTLMPGDLVREHAVVLQVWNAQLPDPDSLLECLDVGIDRSFAQDPLLGFRLLNDIALRAMSTAINDPATAVQALDSIESLLTTIVVRDLAIGVFESGKGRVILDVFDWEKFLAAGVDEIAETQMHPMVRRRLLVVLDRVLAVAPAERRPTVEQRIARMRVASG